MKGWIEVTLLIKKNITFMPHVYYETQRAFIPMLKYRMQLSEIGLALFPPIELDTKFYFLVLETEDELKAKILAASEGE